MDGPVKQHMPPRQPLLQLKSTGDSQGPSCPSPTRAGELSRDKLGLKGVGTRSGLDKKLACVDSVFPEDDQLPNVSAP